MTSIYRQYNACGVILNDKGLNSVELNAIVYSYQMCMRATVCLSAPRQELLHEGVSPRATVLVEGLTN